MNNRRKQNKARLAKLVEAQHGASVTVDPIAVARAINHARVNPVPRPSSVMEPVNLLDQGRPEPPWGATLDAYAQEEEARNRRRQRERDMSTPTRPLINTPLGVYDEVRLSTNHELRLAREAAALEQASHTHALYAGSTELPADRDAMHWSNAQITNDNGALTAADVNRAMERMLADTPRARGRRIRQG